jgi:hypothetical protein
MDVGNQSALGDPLPTRLPLLTPGSGVAIAAAAETAISLTSAGRFGYLQQMEAICTVIGTTAGTWTLRSGLAGTTRLILQAPVAAIAVGSRYIWQFPHPWKTDGRADVFTIQPSVATIGTWVFHVNGFLSSV